MSDRYQQSADVLSADVGDETVALNQETGKYHGLRGSARLLWARLEQPCDIADLAATLARTYTIDDAAAHEEARRFVDGLLQRKLVTPSRADRS